MKRITSVLLGIVLMAGLSFATVLAADTTIAYTKNIVSCVKNKNPIAGKSSGESIITDINGKLKKRVITVSVNVQNADGEWLSASTKSKTETKAYALSFPDYKISKTSDSTGQITTYHYTDCNDGWRSMGIHGNRYYTGTITQTVTNPDY